MELGVGAVQVVEVVDRPGGGLSAGDAHVNRIGAAQTQGRLPRLMKVRKMLHSRGCIKAYGGKRHEGATKLDDGIEHGYPQKLWISVLHWILRGAEPQLVIQSVDVGLFWRAGLEQPRFKINECSRLCVWPLAGLC
jgi:hypothetical protein